MKFPASTSKTGSVEVNVDGTERMIDSREDEEVKMYVRLLSHVSGSVTV